MRFLRAKCAKNAFAAGATRTPVGELTALPDPLAGFKGPTSKGRGGHGRGGEEREGEGKGKEGGGSGKGGKEGKGSCRYFFFPTSSPELNNV